MMITQCIQQLYHLEILQLQSSPFQLFYTFLKRAGRGLAYNFIWKVIISK